MCKHEQFDFSFTSATNYLFIYFYSLFIARKNSENFCLKSHYFQKRFFVFKEVDGF